MRALKTPVIGPIRLVVGGVDFDELLASIEQAQSIKFGTLGVSTTAFSCDVDVVVFGATKGDLCDGYVVCPNKDHLLCVVLAVDNDFGGVARGGTQGDTGLTEVDASLALAALHLVGPICEQDRGV